MRTIVFSDSHLTALFEPDKFAYLHKIISDADRVIINGDFWDYFDVEFDHFISSPWQKLFPLLKSKETIYLYGNHDPFELSDERIERFCSRSGEIYEFEQNGIHFLVQHGHRIAPSIEKQYPWLSNPLFNLFRHILQTVGLWLFGYKYFRIFSTDNKYIKQYAKKYIKDEQILVCGHSHLASFNLKENYIITGTIDYGYAEHLEIDDSGMRIVKARYDNLYKRNLL